MSLFGRFFKKKSSDDMLTDDERELRDYEENEYSGDYGGTEDSYAEFLAEETMTIAGRGTVVVGTVTEGTFRVGDRVKIESAISGNTIVSQVMAIEQFRKITEKASEGANAGMLLKDVKRDQIKRNDIIKKNIKEQLICYTVKRFSTIFQIPEM